MTMSMQVIRRTMTRAAAATAAALLAAACGSSAPSSSSTGSAGTGGTTNISILGAFTADMEPAWIAQGAGFFKKNGLNAKLVDAGNGGTTTSQILAQFIGDNDTLVFTAANTVMSAVQSGQDLKAVYGVRLGADFQMTISKAAAKRHHIPTANKTAAETKKQLKALKGTHLTVAVSSLTSTNYGYTAAILKELGVTYGTTAASDVQFVSAGSATNEKAGVQSGKFDALIGNPPNSIIPGTTVINLGLVQPLASTATIYAAAQTSYIKANRATVAAAVRAMTQAWSWAMANPAKAEAIVTKQYQALGTTDPSVLHQLFLSLQDYWAKPTMTQSAYNLARQAQNLAMPGSVSVAYSKVVDSSFVTTALSSS